MKAIIVAAGRSSRLYPLTSETPKCLLDVGGTSLLDRALDLLDAMGIAGVVVVVGFQHEKIRRRIAGRARCVLNPFFAETNNMGSLWLALPHVGQDDFVYLHADVIFHAALLERLVRNSSGAEIQLLADLGHVDEEAMKVRLAGGRFVESSKSIPLDQASGEWTGLARFAGGVAEPLHRGIETLLAEGRLQDYDTAAFNRLAQAGRSFGITATDGLPWCEIDTPADLARARALFAADSVALEQ